MATIFVVSSRVDDDKELDVVWTEAFSTVEAAKQAAQHDANAQVYLEEEQAEVPLVWREEGTIYKVWTGRDAEIGVTYQITPVTVG